MKNIFFDICSIPIFLLILFNCVSRKMTKGHVNRVFMMLNISSLICAVTDLLSEFMSAAASLSTVAVIAARLLLYIYLVFRNGSLIVYLVFLFVVTRTEYRIRSPRIRLLLWLPNAVTLIVLFQNIFTHNVFTVTAEGGYSRGPLLNVLYVTALVYGLCGTAYCIYCKRYLIATKWAALISVYVLSFIAVFIQFIRPDLLVEMFFTSVGALMVLLVVMRPEESIDTSVGIRTWSAYQMDLSNMLLSNEKIQIAVIQMTNAPEIRTYLGENQYNMYVAEIADEVQQLYRKNRTRVEMYFERPGTFYLLIDLQDVDVAASIPLYLARSRERVRHYMDKGVRFEPRICLIRYPDDLTEMKDILNLGHKFIQLMPHDAVFCKAEDIVHSRTFEIMNNMDEILSRAVTENRLEIYYQPIYNIKEKRFISAEALARLHDSQYGPISPSIFIPAAESMGLILPIGEVVLDSVFRFIAEHDLEALGLSHIEINLSVAQCLQSDLPETIRSLQKKYNVSPKQINFEITETFFDNISNTMDKNLRELTRMGYSFSLDDFGTGYSNIQRLSRLPLRIIKIDKSMVDEMFSEHGKVIIQNTVRMMQGIHKELIVEGVETKEEKDALTDMSCDYIQGFYYSRPLPEKEFIAFLKSHRLTSAA